MKLSLRGSIRKAPNVIEMVFTVDRLYNAGLGDYGVFIRKWNGICGASNRVVGKRALSLKYLLEMTDKDTGFNVKCFVVTCNAIVGALVATIGANQYGSGLINTW